MDTPGIVVINLDACPEKLAAFHDANAHLGPVRRFPAVVGADVDRDELRRRGVIADGIAYSDGALGCALSHLTLWRQIADATRPTTVCEDDAVFAWDFVTLARARLAALPDDWDIVLWGWNFDSWMVFHVLPGRPSCLLQGDGTVTAAHLRAPLASASSQLFRLERACGTLGYAISPKGAAAMLAHCTPLRPMTLSIPEVGRRMPVSGIDLMMSAIYPDLQAFVSIPPLAISPNIADQSTTRGSDLAEAQRKIGRMPLDALVGLVEQGFAAAGPHVRAGVYRTWIEANAASPLLHAAWFNLGCELAQAMDQRGAAQAYRNALQLQPGFEPAAINLGGLAGG